MAQKPLASNVSIKYRFKKMAVIMNKPRKFTKGLLLLIKAHREINLLIKYFWDFHLFERV